MDSTMLLAQALNGWQSILLGIGLMGLAFFLRRGMRLARQAPARDLNAEVRQDAAAAERAAASTIHGLEARLYDYGREIDAKAQTRIAQLDQLALDAERLIRRLDELLMAGRQNAAESNAVEAASSDANRPQAVPAAPEILCGESLSLDERAIVAHLLQAGYRPEQVARLFDRQRPAQPPGECDQAA